MKPWLAMPILLIALSGCASKAITTPNKPFQDSLYREFPGPLETEHQIDRFNIFYCVNRPVWILPSSICDAVDERAAELGL